MAFFVGARMSIRIEKLEQLQNPDVLEKVLDRLRRTTQPRQFAFKKRCKILENKPLLLTAPPGRKVKSSLLRQLRLGTPTYKGIVHREGQQLIFTFTKSVNVTDTARWIAKCMHDAKSPVPLKCIVIRVPDSPDKSVTGQPLKREEDTSTSIILPEIESLPAIDSSLEEPEDLNLSNLIESPTLEALVVKYTSSKKIRWLTETELQLQQTEQQAITLGSTIEDTEIRLYTLELEMNRLQQILLEEDETSTPEDENPWQILFQQCQNTNWSLDEIRSCLDSSPLNTQSLLSELQFLSDDDEMKGFRIVRDYCAQSAEQWNHGNRSILWQQTHDSHQQLTLQHQNLCQKLDSHQETLESIEKEQEATLQKFSERKLDVYQKLQKILLNDLKTPQETLDILATRIQRFQQVNHSN